MFGQNAKLPPIKGDGTTLQVTEIFSTHQGEGPYAGSPAIFVRLSGCNLACRFCDTEFDHYDVYQLNLLMNKIITLAEDHTKLVVITGGEPLRQPIHLLCQSLLNANLKVQLESNGTLYQPLAQGVEIICSLKNTGTQYHLPHRKLIPYITAFKFLISANQIAYNHVPNLGGTVKHIPIYLQPMDEYDEQKNQDNIALCAKLAKKHHCYLSLQMHKIFKIA